MDLKSVLEHLLAPDHAIQKVAESTLASLLAVDLERTLVSLSDFARSTEVPVILRQSAALAFKNALSTKDNAEKAKRHQAWTRISAEAKAHIKSSLLAALQTDQPGLGRSVAQCVSVLAICELAADGWKELIPLLSRSVTDPRSTCKLASLEALGYICEETTVQILSSYTIDIIAAIIAALKPDEPSVEVRVAGAVAFQNSLDFFQQQFENKDERDFIMQLVCEATLAADVRLRTAAMQCIIHIVQLYYLHMEPYIATGLLPISCRAMSADDAEEVLQGIEFWSALCDEEISLKEEKLRAKSAGSSIKILGLVSKNLHNVVPCLLQWLSRQPDQDEEEWIPAKAATVALILMSQCVGDEVVPPILTYVVGGLKSPDWHYRDAACVAFGAILDGPNPDHLQPLVDEAYDHVLQMMSDENAAVRDSAAWVIQRMCEFLGRSTSISPQRLQNTLAVLRHNLTGPARVAANVCWALGALARFSSGVTENDLQNRQRPATSALSPVFSDLIADLFKVGFRADSMQYNLRTASFDALNQLISHSPEDCYPEVQKTAINLHNYINGALEKGMTMNGAERMRYGDYCQHWFTVLESTLLRFQQGDVSSVRVTVFNVCVRTLDLHRSGHSFQAEPEALRTLLTLMDLDPKEFSGNLDVLHSYILSALGCFNEHSIVNGALSLITEICRHYETSVLRFVSSYVQQIILLISSVNDPTGSVIPRAIVTLGEIGLSMGASFYPFAGPSLQCLQSIAEPQDHEVWMLVLDAILEACVGIFQCMGTIQDGGQAMMQDCARFIVPLITSAAGQLTSISDDCIGNCAILMNFLCHTFGREMLPVVDQADFYALLTRGRQVNDRKTKKVCKMTLKELAHLKQMVNSDPVAR